MSDVTTDVPTDVLSYAQRINRAFQEISGGLFFKITSNFVMKFVIAYGIINVPRDSLPLSADEMQKIIRLAEKCERSQLRNELGLLNIKIYDYRQILNELELAGVCPEAYELLVRKDGPNRQHLWEESPKSHFLNRRISEVGKNLEAFKKQHAILTQIVSQS